MAKFSIVKRTVASRIFDVFNMITMILLLILSYRKVDPLAAWLQVPYLLWVTFAAYLNFGVWMLNR